MTEPRAAAGPVPEHFVVGDGDPTTLFVPGLAMSIPDTRPFGSGVPGTRVFCHLRGHGGSVPPPDDPDAWTYRGLADDVRSVADATGAQQALGVSLGAAAVLVAALRDPRRFRRLVLALPSSLDQPRPSDAVTRAQLLADAVDAGDQPAITAILVEWQPPAVRSRMDLKVWARRHADWLSRSSVAHVLRALPAQAPFADPSQLEALTRIDVPVLVLAQSDDPVHPVAVAERLAGLLPDARLEVSGVPWLWGARDRLRDTVAGFLGHREADG